jgi:hypothetical protein
MRTPDWDAVLDAATGPARADLDSLSERRVHPATTPDEIRAVVDVPLTDAGVPPVEGDGGGPRATPAAP